MVDTDFERAMRANLAPVDEYIDGLIAKASPQWKAVVLSEKPEPNPDCCTDTGGWENLVWVNNIKENA